MGATEADTEPALIENLFVDDAELTVPRGLVNAPDKLLEEMAGHFVDKSYGMIPKKEESDISKLAKRHDVEFPRRQKILRDITKSDREKQVGGFICEDY